MRGLAVVIMIQCHTFNSFVRPDLRDGGGYELSQFIGGMAAPLFLFMAGMTLGFQMDSLDRRERNRSRRWLGALRRALYVLGLAFAFRFSNFVASLPHVDWAEIIKVDILNCMGVGLIVFSVAALFEGRNRVRFAAGAALAVAAVTPLVAMLPWDQAPALIREYVVPVPGRGHFSFFPCASYVGFGLALGAVVKSAMSERLMQWSFLLGSALILCGQYFGAYPYSFYSKSDFWMTSPTLILIRVGVTLLMLSGAYVWTTFCVGAGWSWMQSLGRNSLMVYWVHVMLVYGDILKRFKLHLTIAQAGVATVVVTLLMLGLSAGWQWWKLRRSSQDLANLGSQHLAAERLGQEVHAGLENAVVDDRVLRVAGKVEHL